MTSQNIASAIVMIKAAMTGLLMGGMLPTHPVMEALADIAIDLEETRKEFADMELDDNIEKLNKAKSTLEGAGRGHNPLTPSLPQSTTLPASPCVDSFWEAM
jgi:hypothetical protein